MEPDLAYLGEKIRARCAEHEDCLQWQGATDVKGVPRFAIRIAGWPVTVQPRRVIWSEAKGPIPGKKRVSMTCGNLGCLNVEHMELITPGQVISRTAKNALTQIRRRQAGLKSRQRSALNLEIVRHIRTSPQTGAALSKELGIPETTISAIRLHKRWKEDAVNPFAGLLAANDSRRRVA